MDHLVQFTISIDDAHIANLVEKQAASVLSDEVIKIVKKTIRTDSIWEDRMSEQALKEISKFLEAHKDYIVQETAREIATRFMRTKKNKDAILERLGDE